MAKDKEDMGHKDLGKEGMHKPDEGGKLGGDVGKQGGIPEKKEWSPDKPEKKEWDDKGMGEKKPGA